MGPGQRRRLNLKGRNPPQGDGQALCPCLEQREITKDHPSCFWMHSTKDVHKSGPGGTNQVLHHVHRIFKELDRFHVCPAVATPHQWEECTNQPRGAVSTYMEDINSDDKDSVMLPLIYPEESNNEESLDEPPSAEPTPEPRTPSGKPTLQPKNWHRRVQSLSTKPLHRS